MTWRGSAKRSGTNPSWDVVQTWRPTYKKHLTSVIATRALPQVLSHVLRRGSKYLFHSLKCKSIYNFFEMRFPEVFCCYSVSHCSNKPTIKIIDRSFLCQWANVQNQQRIKKKKNSPTVYKISKYIKTICYTTLLVRSLVVSSACHYFHKILSNKNCFNNKKYFLSTKYKNNFWRIWHWRLE